MEDKLLPISAMTGFCCYKHEINLKEEKTIMEKKTFVTLEQLEAMTKTYPTPFHLYDEKGIRENALKMREAFSWNKGFKEYLQLKPLLILYI